MPLSPLTLDDRIPPDPVVIALLIGIAMSGILLLAVMQRR